jgi:prepilin-type N-terminal cleavage/methylation domain-containing protein
MKNLHKKAFSLIEISVVILIIGILIAGISQGIDLYQDSRLAIARSLTQNSRVGRIENLEL